MENKFEMASLVRKLNEYRNAYYNENTSLITDKQYDELFDKLQQMEDETGIILSNSPTQTVGYTVQNKLNKVKHTHPMLSLDKTKEVSDIIKFAKNKNLVASLKMDGLTCSLHYDENGDLVSAETRGNGEVGEDIFENAKQISNIPLHIRINHPLTIDGEVIVDYETFNKINENLENKYSHPRNLASGSIRQLDTKITKERNLKFIPWKVIDGIDYNSFSGRLIQLEQFGFEVVPFQMIITDMADDNVFEEVIDFLKEEANNRQYPIDGLVFTYDNIAYGESLGQTGHHPRHSLAFKFYDDCYETILRDIEWNPSRTGIVAPVAVFDPVDLDGAITTRATLHNVSIMKELQLGIGDTITVYRANAVIPKVDDNLTRSNTYEFPTVCPVCGEPLELRKDGIAEMLYCNNPECSAKKVAQFEHFVSKAGMNIEGLSEATLEKLLDLGYITDFKSIYNLSQYEYKIVNLVGFGKTSFKKLINSIDTSRKVKLENFINALGINQIGVKASKAISKFVDGSWTTLKYKILAGYDFSQLEDFGLVTNKAIYDYFTTEKINELDTLVDELQFEMLELNNSINNFINGKTFVVTGKFNSMTRNDIEKLITDNNGKLSGSVSKSTSYLLTNDTESGSSKNKKAKELNIPIMTEEEFLQEVNNGK